MTAIVCSAVMISQAALGCAFGRHTIFREPPTVECSDSCGAQSPEVVAKIQVLQTSPRWRQRDNAAHALRRYDWQCHPEIVLALAAAVQTDCCEEVREEAAETLAKLNPPPCVPGVHETLAYAAKADPDHATRKWARRAIARFEGGCTGDCSVCDPGQPGAGYVVGRPVFPPPVYTLPRNGAYIVPGAQVHPFSTPPGFGTEPELIREVPAPTYVEPAPSYGNDPLDNLPPIEGLPAPLNPEPSIPPPPPVEASPFDSAPRAERRFDSRVAERNEPRSARDETRDRIAQRDRDDDDRDRDAARAPRRRIFPFSLIGRRGR